MRKESGSTNLNTYSTGHLPAKFQEQRKLLLPYYKEAKKNKKKTMWKALDGNYTLFIDIGFFDLIRCFCNQIRCFCNQIRSFCNQFCFFFAINFVLQKLLYIYLCIGSPNRVYIYIYVIWGPCIRSP